MDMIPRNDYGERCQFDAYCKLVLYHEAIDYLREMQRRRDTVFLFKEVQMLLSGGVFKPVSIQKYLTLPSSSTLWIRSRTMSLSEPPLILHTGEYDRIRIRCALHILV